MEPMTLEQIDREIQALTAQLHEDERPCRPAEGEQGISVPIERKVLEMNEELGLEVPVMKVIGHRIESSDASTIRAERAAVKARRRELRLLKQKMIYQLEAELTRPRSVEEIEADITIQMAERRSIRRSLAALNRERDRAIAAAKVAAMSDVEKAALREALKTE